MSFQSDGSDDDDIFVDTIPLGIALTKTNDAPTTTKQSQLRRKVLPAADKSIVNKMMKKAVLSSDYDQKPIEEVISKSTRAKRKERKAIRESTKGNKWYNMPATELTQENRRDLELLQMRVEIDPKSQYRKNDRKALPKYFQTGTVVDNAADFYSARINKKQRKQTMVDELLSGAEHALCQSKSNSSVYK